MRLRLLTYNILRGGLGRTEPLTDVIGRASPDLVVLQEATRPDVVERVAGATGMTAWASERGHSVGFMSRLPIGSHRWYRPRGCRRAFLEIVLEGSGLRVFGVHLSAIHSNWTERRRVRELRALLEGIREHQHGLHLVAGDFNTLAPGEELDLRQLPTRYRAVLWLTGRKIRWQTIQIMLDARYADAYRLLHPEEAGYTFPTWNPHVRLDYVFVPVGLSGRLASCDLMRGIPAAATASDHFPVSIVLDVP